MKDWLFFLTLEALLNENHPFLFGHNLDRGVFHYPQWIVICDWCQNPKWSRGEERNELHQIDESEMEQRIKICHVKISGEKVGREDVMILVLCSD